jgi:NhaA family Na+:H+ antiporter
VIALFYSPELEPTARLYSVAALALLAAFNLGNIRRPLPYIVVGAALWYFVHESGVHATIAGILLAAALPARGPEPPCERWEHALTPWVTFVVVPVFAFANAGIDLSEERASEVVASKLAMGVLLGLAAGKFIGISAFSALAVRAGIARLPEGVGWRHLLGAAWLGGIGFTMSLFIAQLAFSDARAVEQAKVGIMLASVLSALCGLVWLAVAAPRRGGELPAAR